MPAGQGYYEEGRGTRDAGRGTTQLLSSRVPVPVPWPVARVPFPSLYPNRSTRNGASSIRGASPAARSATQSPVSGARRMPLREWPQA